MRVEFESASGDRYANANFAGEVSAVLIDGRRFVAPSPSERVTQPDVPPTFEFFRCLSCGFSGEITTGDIARHRSQCAHGPTVAVEPPITASQPVMEVAPIDGEPTRCRCGCTQDSHALIGRSYVYCMSNDCDCINFRLAAPPIAPIEATGETKCGKPAKGMIPRRGMYFACVLGKGHDGECMPGGRCFAHGDYVGDECPKWPDCIGDHPDFARSASPPQPATREKRLENALREILNWKMPGNVWVDGYECSYGVAYGSQGEKEHIRSIARDALEVAKEPVHGRSWGRGHR